MRRNREEGGEIENKWMGVLVTNNQLDEEEKKRREPPGNNFIILDNITMDEDEKEYLNLPYKFREFEPMSCEKLENEVKIHAINLRYELMDEDEHDEEEEDDMTPEEKEKAKETQKNEYKKSTMIMDKERGELDMGT